MNLSAIILAAGKGARMRSSIPKVMHKVAAKPMLWHIMKTIHELDINEVSVVIGPDMEMIDSYLKVEFGLAKTIIQEERLGTAHAVTTGLEIIKHKSNNIIVLYGDTPFIKAETIKKMNELITDDAALVVLGFIAKDPARYGRLVINENGKLDKIAEYLDATDQEKTINLCNSGIMLLNSKYIHLLKLIKNNNAKNEFYLTDLVEIAKAQNLKCAYFSADETEVLGVNSRKDLAYAESVLQQHLRARMIESGVELVQPEMVTFAADIQIGMDCVIHPYVVFGAGVAVHSGVEIRSFSHIEGAEIASGAVIGPYARLRPGSHIATKARVGNFVEVKNTHIGENSKVNHLSYIGDTIIGKNVNIGAGVITCNYDGFNKNQTEIDDEAFIGSNSSLIAPVKIGKNVIVAAGSVITKNIEEGSLAIARAKEKILPGKSLILKKRAKEKSIKINKKL